MKPSKLYTILFLLYISLGNAQEKTHLQPFPFLSLSRDYQSKVVKPLPRIIFLFSSSCSNAYSSLPTLKNISEWNGSKLQIGMIGRNDYKTKTDYKNYEAFYQLAFPITYDSEIFKEIAIETLPSVVWINRNGNIVAITGTSSLLQKNVSKFINDEIPPHLPGKSVTESAKPIFSSSLSESPEGSTRDAPFRLPDSISSFSVLAASGENLFQLAFLKSRYINTSDKEYGNVSANIILDQFNREDSIELKKRYNYTIESFQDNHVDIVRWMQQDLQRLFSMRARVEEKEMPYYAFIAADNDTTRVSTKFKSTSGTASGTEIKVRNGSRYNVIHQLYRLQHSGIPIIDETGMKGNIDISIEGVLSNMNTLKTQLTRSGFDLIPKKKLMRVLILTPKRNESVTRE